MLHIVLLVLKIIGILVFIILGLALFLLLAGLTVPVRYGIRGFYYGKIKGSIKITWLLHIVSAVISYDGEPFVRVKLLGIPVYRPDKKKAGEIGREALDVLEPEIPAAKEAADGAENTVKRAGKKIFGKGKKKQRTSGKDGTDKHKDGKKQARTPEKEAAEPGARKEALERQAADRDGSSKSSGKGPFHRFIKIWGFFKNIPRKVTGVVNRLRRLYRRIIGRLRQADTSVRELKAWIEDEENKKMIREVWHHAKALIRHGLPRKVKGKVVFGFDDPYVTGQVLSYAAMLYPFYGRQISIQPVFDQVILECEGTIKGRIRVATVCIRLFGAYRNKNFKALIKKWMG